MPRKKRKVSSQGLYHVLQRGIDKRDIFLERRDFEYYLECLAKAKENWNFTLISYCLMSNHVHLLIQVDSLEALAIIMQFLGQDYARWHNYKYERTGHLFDNRYRSFPIEDFNVVISTLQYIHLNPLHACLVSNLEEYPWSSHLDYLASYSIGSDKEHSPSVTFTNWLHHYYPTRRLYVDYMTFAITSRVSAKDLPRSDQEYRQDIQRTLHRVTKEAPAIALEIYNQLSNKRKARHSFSSVETYWTICRIQALHPTTTRQLGRVLGYSRNIIIRALRSKIDLCSPTALQADNPSL